MAANGWRGRTNDKREYDSDSSDEQTNKRAKHNNELQQSGGKTGSSKLQNEDSSDKYPSSSIMMQSYHEGTPTSVLTKQASTTSTDFGNSAKKLDCGSSKENKAIRARLDMNNNGEYILKLTSVQTNNAATEQAHTAAVLLSQGEILRKLGQKLLSELGASYESEIYRKLNMEAMLN